MVIAKTSPSLQQVLGIYRRLITTNCAVLGVPLLNIANRYNLVGIAPLRCPAFRLAPGALRRHPRDGSRVPTFPAISGRRHRHGDGRPHVAGLQGLRRPGQVPVMEIVAIAIWALGAIVLGPPSATPRSSSRSRATPHRQDRSVLPQTQHGQCGYPGCHPYAEAIAKGDAKSTSFPRGMEGVQKLADLLGREVKPLEAEEKPPQVAIIDENTCIGCTLCIQACPVDAIVGAAKQMHHRRPPCTGCELCLPPRPWSASPWSRSAESLDNWKWKYPVVAIPAEKKAA